MSAEPVALSASVEKAILIAVGFLAAMVLFYVAGIAKRAKGLIWFKIRSAFVGLALYAFTVLTFTSLKYSVEATVITSFLAGISPLAFMKLPKRSRYIPARVRKAVIARDLDGEELDPRQYHLDHVVPFAKGGDHSVKNLRVLTKGRNLKKGAKMPGLRDLL